jgi:hypothetical protein
LTICGYLKGTSENTYRVQVDTCWDALVRSYQNKLVTFVDHSDTGIQLPLPETLAIHALFAKAFRDSGTAKFLRDQEVSEVAGLNNLALALRSLVIK